MKALLISLTNYEHYNFGNTLQCYAANQLLTELGMETDTLCVEPVQKIHFKNSLVALIHKLTGYRLSGFPQYWKMVGTRNRRFQEFEKQYFSMKYTQNLTALAKAYDYYVVGSDQVWNTSWYHECPLYAKAFLASFTGSENKICMMPSFGSDSVAPAWEETFQAQLPKFRALSVREEKGREIINKLTGLEAEVLVDPTLVLESRQWEKLAKKPEEADFSKPYILTYFLEGTAKGAAEHIRKLAEEYDFAVLNMDSESENSVYSAGPAEFLYLFSHASLVVTNSFHACVFSYQFHRPFLVYEREGMMSRIYTLLGMLGLENRLVKDKLPEQVLECDFSKADARMETERKKARLFLQKSVEQAEA